MKRIFLGGIIFQLIFSCSFHEKFPEPVTLPVTNNGEVFLATTELGSGQNDVQHKKNMPATLNDLFEMQQMYLQEDRQFVLENFFNSWTAFKNTTTLNRLTEEEVFQWFKLTGFAFQLTGKAECAEEMEKVAWQRFSGKSGLFDSLVSPYIFTKKVDHIHVNLFLPNEISYAHTLGGNVNIVQETDFPKSGSIRLNFSMEIKRYIEIFVRIPSWAENASVTVKGVKYFAQPGRYSIIAKKWKEGDVVEIEFPMENIPDYLKREI
jgi:hypothetical protein